MWWEKLLVQIKHYSQLPGLYSALGSCFYSFMCLHLSPAPTGPAFLRLRFQVCSWDVSCSWNSCTSLGYPPATWSYREVSSGHGQFSDDLVPLTSLDGYFWLCCLCSREVGLRWERGKKSKGGACLGFPLFQGPTKVGTFILPHLHSTYWMSGLGTTKLIP